MLAFLLLSVLNDNWPTENSGFNATDGKVTDDSCAVYGHKVQTHFSNVSVAHLM